MKDNVKKVVVIAVLVLLSAIVWVWVSTTYTPETKSSYPSKAGYLKIVEDNYKATDELTLAETRCVYGYLLDTYGVEETLGMDNRVTADPTDVDPRAFEAIDRCL